jgi:hypothetical protein
MPETDTKTSTAAEIAVTPMPIFKAEVSFPAHRARIVKAAITTKRPTRLPKFG